MLNRFANIFYHYYSGPILGVGLQLWPIEREYARSAQLFAVATFISQLALFFLVPMPALVRAGLALILFSPQWLYTFLPSLPHPVFEFRGYGMAAGIALILGSVVSAHPVLAVALIVTWGYHSIARFHILTDPLRFWKRAEEEQSHGS